jgi:hypothetical protein
MRRLVAVCLLTFLPAGCTSTWLSDDSAYVPPGAEAPCENPVLLLPNFPPGEGYAELFDQVLDAVDDYFPIAYANRYEGRVLGRPTIAPGYEQLWRPGSPDQYERTLATLQSYRYRCEVRIREADPAGYFVLVTVRKELKDAPAPASVATAVPVFGDGGTVDRDLFVVADPAATSPLEPESSRWIPKGREPALERAIIQKLRCGQ